MICSICGKKIKGTVHIVFQNNSDKKKGLKLDHTCTVCYKKIKDDPKNQKAA